MNRDFRAVLLCPRCEGQKYDRGNCGVCESTGRLGAGGQPNLERAAQLRRYQALRRRAERMQSK